MAPTPISNTVFRNNYMKIIASMYNDPVRAEALLRRIEFPVDRIPSNFQNSQHFWLQVTQLLEDGVIENGFQTLLCAALTDYPFKEELKDIKQGCEAKSGNNHRGAEPQRFVHLVLEGNDNLEELDALITRTAEELGLEVDSIRLGFANAEGVLFNLEEWEMGAAFHLMNQINDANLGISASVGDASHRDYLINRLYIEGPDQQRFEFKDVRASTPVRDIGEGVMSQYEGGGAASNVGRSMVVDIMNEDGSTRRLNPDKTLHEEGIKEDATLAAHPESRAGLTPDSQHAILLRVKKEISAYSAEHPDFKVRANSRIAPTEYILNFHAPSYAPPVQPGEQPIRNDDHQVLLSLPEDFPQKAPLAIFETPIFHPNVWPQRPQKICLGVLEDLYDPALDFRQLCEMIVDITTFRNYALEGGYYNQEALLWLLSEAGVKAIEGIGGTPVKDAILLPLLRKNEMLRRLMNISLESIQPAKPRKMQIKKYQTSV